MLTKIVVKIKVYSTLDCVTHTPNEKLALYISKCFPENILEIYVYKEKSLYKEVYYEGFAEADVIIKASHHCYL